MIALRRGAQIASFRRQLAAARRRTVSTEAARSSPPSASSHPSAPTPASTSRRSSPSSSATARDSHASSATARDSRAASAPPRPRKTLTPGPHEHVHEVNKSRFVATAFGGVASPAEALEMIKRHSHRDASHNCFAFVVRRGISERCSDDGEPASTAGKPILSAISGEGLENVAVVVSRWRFGPKLGPGGLSRAYGAAARECLRGAEVVELEDRADVVVVVDVGDVGSARAALASRGATAIEEDYSGEGRGDVQVAQGQVKLSASVPASSADGLAKAIANATAGRGSVAVSENERTV